MIGEQIIKRTKLQPTQKNKRKGGYLKAFSQLVGGKRPFFLFSGRETKTNFISSLAIKKMSVQQLKKSCCIKLS